jgi:hypothetical protein
MNSEQLRIHNHVANENASRVENKDGSKMYAVLQVAADIGCGNKTRGVPATRPSKSVLVGHR